MVKLNSTLVSMSPSLYRRDREFICANALQMTRAQELAVARETKADIAFREWAKAKVDPPSPEALRYTSYCCYFFFLIRQDIEKKRRSKEALINAEKAAASEKLSCEKSAAAHKRWVARDNRNCYYSAFHNGVVRRPGPSTAPKEAWSLNFNQEVDGLGDS